MYQGASDEMLAPRDPIPLADESWGCDLEAEVIVVTDDVPRGISREEALEHIKLIGLVNDVSLRGLIPAELAKGFGFLQSKPASALSPVLVTPRSEEHPSELQSLIRPSYAVFCLKKKRRANV